MAYHRLTEEELEEYNKDLYVNPIDEYVGNLLRLKLSEKKFTHYDLGITQEMLEDYIEGNVRIGSARLFEFSLLLDMPVMYFFEGFEPAYDQETNLNGHVSPQLLLSSFYRATITKRKKVMKLLNI